MDYTIEVKDYYIFVRGEIPTEDFGRVAEFAEVNGFRILDTCAGYALGGFVFTDKHGSARLRAEIDERNKDLPAEERWIRGWDRGVSSETIFYVMTGKPKPGLFGAGVPHDPDDFGRCFRLLEKFPEWRERLSGVAAKHPEWTGLVENWTELEAIYKRDLARAGGSLELYKKLQGLIGEAQ